ncbi:GNAT family N-acetyltransferase [Amnibacterium kyonggiense]|uniref:Ribosomal protein S18 acetylase RimI-like enzyme n=1 Tax=Amnibacterium kyonggiense TaxID=595671 RepID=A0A4R7FKD1_9MICO|nr:N-acetyltransferase [Amnibacterium kyonggiense]TDS76799.1 ribosomal protein S18 acetylase RimI-like enzyme [Amnibacterium kyonggiense]
MTVRAARPADAAALAEVAAATFGLACPPSTPQAAIDEFIATALSESAFTRYLADPARALLVAETTPGRPFDGYAMLVLGEPADPDVAGALRVRPTVELSKIYVRADGHGRGTAAELLARALEAGRARGAAGMWLGTNQENERAQRFYAKHGFERVGVKRFRLGDRYEDDFVFERPL